MACRRWSPTTYVEVRRIDPRFRSRWRMPEGKLWRPQTKSRSQKRARKHIEQHTTFGTGPRAENRHLGTYFHFLRISSENYLRNAENRVISSGKQFRKVFFGDFLKTRKLADVRRVTGRNDLGIAEWKTNGFVYSILYIGEGRRGNVGGGRVGLGTEEIEVRLWRKTAN